MKLLFLSLKEEDLTRSAIGSLSRLYSYQLNCISYLSAMAKYVVISGAFSVAVFVLSVLFKLLQWTGAPQLLMISLISFALIFIPLLAISLIKKIRK